MTTTAETPSLPRRRRWPKRLFIAVLVLANLVVFGAYSALRYYSGKIDAELVKDEEVVAVLSSRPTERREPINILLIGSDSRENLPDDFAGNFGDFGGQRADVIMLVQLLSAEGRARLLSLPRDLQVTLPGHGTQKLNAAYSFGGGSLAVSTVRDITGLPVHHYAEVDFVGFASLVDALGGVTFDFAFPARDVKSGLKVSAGRQTLDGPTALAYARSRTYQELRDGSWVSVDANDIGRTHRQQQIVLAILNEVKSPSTIADAGKLIEAFAGYVTVDASLDQDALIELAWAMRSLDAAGMETVTLPTITTVVGDVYYELPDEPAASSVLSAFRTGAPLALAVEGPIRIQVLNGNGIPGAAARWAGEFSDARFAVVGIGDASSDDFPTTVVVTPSDRIAQGEAVVEKLGFGELSPGSVPEGVDVVVVVGADAAAG